MSVLTLAVLISYMRRTASVICRLVARTSTMKTRVLLSSIFFMADSVVSGYFRMQYWSSLLVLGIDLRGYLGSRALMRVFGLWKVALRRTLVVRFWVPFLMAFAAAFGLAAGFLASFGGITGLYERAPC